MLKTFLSYAESYTLTIMIVLELLAILLELSLTSFIVETCISVHSIEVNAEANHISIEQ